MLKCACGSSYNPTFIYACPTCRTPSYEINPQAAMLYYAASQDRSLRTIKTGVVIMTIIAVVSVAVGALVFLGALGSLTGN